MLLAVLRGAHFAHWTSHWQVKGSNFYGDHEMMDNIYNTLIEEIDTLAEKIVGAYGGEAVNAVEQAQIMANHLLPLAEAHSMNNPIRRALLIEEGLQVIFRNTYDMLKEQGGLTLGMDDFIMSMANTHETNLYLLRRRCED
jgi:starvation-inducible DNA-binding protein